MRLDEHDSGMQYEIASVYVIYDADVAGPDAERALREMSPEYHMPAGYKPGSEDHALMAGTAAKFAQTEGDEQYEFETDFGPGMHRKWGAELGRDDWDRFCHAYIIPVDEDLMPTEYEETLGSLTPEYGHIPAVSIDNSEGWGDGRLDARVIRSQFYVSIAMGIPGPGNEGS